MISTSRSHYRSDDGPLLAIADAVGCVGLHRLNSIDVRRVLFRIFWVPLQTRRHTRKSYICIKRSPVLPIQCYVFPSTGRIDATPNSMPLSLIFSGFILNLSFLRLGSIITSRSDGQLSNITPSPSGWEALASWPAHDFEAWIAAWNYFNNNIIYSGKEFH